MSTYSIEHGYRKGPSLWRRGLAVLVGFMIPFSGYLIYQNPKPAANISQPVAAQSERPVQPKVNLPISWPKYGQSAYGVAGQGVLGSSNNNAQPVPIASLAKVITALAVLKQKPLAPGQPGPMITLNEQDIALYTEYVAKNGAVVPIEAGEQISQHQAMQAMLMSSANNMSDSLARWAFGSVDAYNAYANKMVKELGLTQTTVADASGFSSSTKSTAPELVQLGILYMQNPVLKGIATQSEARIPFAGLIKNYNSVANIDGVLGLKVGNTDEAGRCFLVADMRGDSKNNVSVVAVIGADHLDTAIKDAKTVLSAGNKSYDQLVAN